MPKATRPKANRDFTVFMKRVLEPGPLVIPAPGDDPLDVRKIAKAIAEPLNEEDLKALRNMYRRFDPDLSKVLIELAFRHDQGSR